MACEIKDPTNNPICSDSLKDLKDNTIIMDQYINSEEFIVPDRLGIPRKTWAGLEKDVQDALANLDPKVEQLIADKIIAQGGVEIANEWGDSLEKVINQDFITNNLGYFTPEMFGAKGDGISDDSPAVNDALINSRLNNSSVFFGSKTYIVDSVIIKNGDTIHGCGAGITKIKNIAGSNNPSFKIDNNDPLLMIQNLNISGLSFVGDGVSVKYMPEGATGGGLDLDSGSVDVLLNDVHINSVNFEFCKIGLNVPGHIRFMPITNCAFTSNELGFFLGNEHPALNNIEFRYNKLGMTGVAQDMHINNVRFSYNDIGSTVRFSRSIFTNVLAWQNKTLAIGNLFEYNSFSGCLMRGAGTFWEGIGYPKQESGIIEVSSRGNKFSGVQLYGGNSGYAINLISNNPQEGFQFTDGYVLLDSGGGFLNKKGTGTYSAVNIGNTIFNVSTTRQHGGMIVNSETTGNMTTLNFSNNHLLFRTISQDNDFINLTSNGSIGHTICDNVFQASEGIDGKGLSILNQSNLQFTGNYFQNTFSTKLNDATVKTGSIIKDNRGYKTQGQGYGIVPQGSDFVVVNHGLDVKPNITNVIVNIRQSNMTTPFYAFASDVTEETITLKMSTANTSSTTLNWMVSL